MKLADIEPTDVDKVVTLDMAYGYYTAKVLSHEIYQYGYINEAGEYQEVIKVIVTFPGDRKFEETRVVKNADKDD